MPHPIAAGNRLEGWGCQGWRFVPSRSDATGGSALDWPALEATSSVAGEAPVPMRARCVLVAAWRMSDGDDARRMRGLVRHLQRVLARRAPGGPKAEPGAAPGCGGAQRSRLDPGRLNSATDRYLRVVTQESPGKCVLASACPRRHSRRQVPRGLRFLTMKPSFVRHAYAIRVDAATKGSAAMPHDFACGS